MLTHWLLFFAALISAYVDSIAGGGGLITVPALLLAGLPHHLALGTNKAQAVFGVATSLWKFSRSPLLDRPRFAVSFPSAFVGSVIGTLTVLYIHKRNDAILNPLVLILLATVAISMIFQRLPAAEDRPRHHAILTTLGVAVAIGFYDGFFGPGTGMFAILIYAWFWRDPLDRASANAKSINCASNLASMLTFVIAGAVVWKYAIPMIVGQLIGGYLGTHTVITGGRRVVRVFVIAMSLLLLGRLAWQVVTGR